MTRELNFYSDYIRLAAFELCAHEIRRHNISGATAEVGVYRGNFAKKINEAFPDKILYLFDTFNGFTDHELKEDLEGGLAQDKKFVSVTPEAVLAIMPYPEKCKIKVGPFDKTSLEHVLSFAFVSLDVDLYRPTIEGLRAFWEKLSPGGYIFVHDYNNDDWGGIKKAVDEFRKENRAVVVPLPDAHGSVIISKP